MSSPFFTFSKLILNEIDCGLDSGNEFFRKSIRMGDRNDVIIKIPIPNSHQSIQQIGVNKGIILNPKIFHHPNRLGMERHHLFGEQLVAVKSGNHSSRGWVCNGEPFSHYIRNIRKGSTKVNPLPNFFLVQAAFSVSLDSVGSEFFSESISESFLQRHRLVTFSYRKINTTGVRFASQSFFHQPTSES